MENHIIFGSSGMIGSQLVRSLKEKKPSAKILTTSRPSKEGLTVESVPEDFSSRLVAGAPTYAYWCQGPTDPAVASSVQHKFAVELPTLWQNWFTAHTDLKRFTTFGSVHEAIADLCQGNQYLTAKREWYLGLSSAKPALRHFQLHTLYGAPLRATSFVGQMANAIHEDIPFKMSHGQQFREYHFSKDIADLVVSTLGDEFANRSRVLQLSHGRPLKLRDIASAVFAAFGRETLLEIGAAPTRTEEVLQANWSSTPAPFRLRDRDPIEGIVALIREAKG